MYRHGPTSPRPNVLAELYAFKLTATYTLLRTSAGKVALLSVWPRSWTVFVATSLLQYVTKPQVGVSKTRPDTMERHLRVAHIAQFNVVVAGWPVAYTATGVQMQPPQCQQHADYSQDFPKSLLCCWALHCEHCKVGWMLWWSDTAIFL